MTLVVTDRLGAELASHEMAPPISDDAFLASVDAFASAFGVPDEEREAALIFLAAVQAPVSEEYLSRREQLVERALNLLPATDNPKAQDEIVTPSLFLLRRLANFDYPLAEEGVDVAELGLAIAERVDGITGAETDRLAVWSDGLGHDDGKEALDPELNRVSQEGEIWEPYHHEAMTDHSFWGYVMSLAAGLRITVARTKYANHAKQTGKQYGEEITLDPEERRIRDFVAAADDILACLTRSNSRNRYLTENERWARVLGSLLWRFGDYAHLSDNNNPGNIAREVQEVGREYIGPRYRIEQESSGLVVVHKLGLQAIRGASQ